MYNRFTFETIEEFEGIVRQIERRLLEVPNRSNTSWPLNYKKLLSFIIFYCF